jgi:hypothetical protein
MIHESVRERFYTNVRWASVLLGDGMQQAREGAHMAQSSHWSAYMQTCTPCVAKHRDDICVSGRTHEAPSWAFMWQCEEAEGVPKAWPSIDSTAKDRQLKWNRSEQGKQACCFVSVRAKRIRGCQPGNMY